MAQYKKRVEWHVRLNRCNVGPHKGEWQPRAVLRGTATLDDLARWVHAHGAGGMFTTEQVKLVGQMLMAAATDMLVDGFAVDTPLGRLTPVVRGMWNLRRIDPKARAQNRADVSFSTGPMLEEALDNPLFRETDGLMQGPMVFDVFDLSSGTHGERLTPGGHVFLKGRHLLMNGDLPERGVELLDADTEAVVHRFSADEVAGYMNSHTRITLILPATLPAGRYRLAVTSQCSTSPRPLTYANRAVDARVLQVEEKGISLQEQ